MPDVIIENPVLNPPFEEPCRHFRFGDEGITNEIVPERRVSSYFVPIKKGKQLVLDTGWTAERIQETSSSTASGRGWRSGGRAVTTA
jgi:type III restriction enzyme